MKTAPTNKKIRELIHSVKEGRIVPRPEFQRRLVWKIEDKNHFLDSVIKGYPFPEIYLADGEVDLDTGVGTQLLVDGLQRVSTIVQYFEGVSDLKLTTVPPYHELESEQKVGFLQYDVAVRDLGSISKEEIVEVFRRINSTKYSLTDIEISNAVYRGELKEFAETLSTNRFFDNHQIFKAQDIRRMGDLRFALGIIITAAAGYFNRDDLFEAYLEQYNDDFPGKVDLAHGFENVFDFIDECGFSPKSRVWRKADLFTLISELMFVREDVSIGLDPLHVVESLEHFYSQVENADLNRSELPSIYYKSTVQASNDRLNRVRRGVIVGGFLKRLPLEEIMEALDRERLL